MVKCTGNFSHRFPNRLRRLEKLTTSSITDNFKEIWLKKCISYLLIRGFSVIPVLEMKN